VLLATAFIALLARQGFSGFYAFQRAGHGSSLEMNFLVATLAWIAFGALAALSCVPAFARRHGGIVFVVAILGFAWLNDIREPHVVRVGDFGAYFEAARAIHDGVPIVQAADRLYLYPPLLATLLSPLTPLGLERTMMLFDLASFGALLGCMALLYVLLPRFRVSRDLAAVAIACLFAANVPVSRTFIYHQVNLFVVLAMLGSFAVHPRRPLLSAALLAVAVHLKVYPVLLVLPFLRVRDYRWLIGFVAANLAIIVGTSSVSGFDRYLDFARQAAGLQETALRNASLDAIVRSTASVFGFAPPPLLIAAAAAVRLCLALGVIALTEHLSRRGAYVDGDDRARVVRTGFALLPLAMLLVSPSIWEHHAVFLVLTMPVIAASLRTSLEGWMFASAHVFLFWLPVFDIWPLSYLRFVAYALLLGLLALRARSRGDGPPEWLVRLESAVATLRSSTGACGTRATAPRP
jgi:hypothetical protein